jgi:hypothetical protein
MMVKWASKAVKILDYPVEAISCDEFRDIMFTIEEQDIAHQFGWDFDNLSSEQGLIIARNIIRRVNGYNGPLDFNLKKVGIEWQHYKCPKAKMALTGLTTAKRQDTHLGPIRPNGEFTSIAVWHHKEGASENTVERREKRNVSEPAGRPCDARE